MAAISIWSGTGVYGNSGEPGALLGHNIWIGSPPATTICIVGVVVGLLQQQRSRDTSPLAGLDYTSFWDTFSPWLNSWLKYLYPFHSKFEETGSQRMSPELPLRDRPANTCLRSSQIRVCEGSGSGGLVVLVRRYAPAPTAWMSVG